MGDGKLIKNMVDLMLSNVAGRIFAYNCYFTDSYNLIDREYIKNYIVGCFERFHQRDLCTFRELYKIFHVVAKGYKNDDESKISYFLLGENTCSEFNDVDSLKVSNVIDFSSLDEYILDRKKVYKKHKYLDGIPDYNDEKNIVDICKIIRNKDMYKKDAMLGGNKERPMFWITCAKNIEMDREKRDSNIGNNVRDRLGLIHHKENTYLMELEMSSDLIKKSTHRPTFVDGHNHLRFKIVKKVRSSDYEDWGFTADLNMLANCCSEIDGVPERVVEPLSINKNIIIKYIGRVDFERGKSKNDDDETFLKNISAGVSISRVKKYFLEDLWEE